MRRGWGWGETLLTAVKSSYLSLTAKWTDDKPGLHNLKAALEEILKARDLPYFHKLPE